MLALWFDFWSWSGSSLVSKSVQIAMESLQILHANSSTNEEFIKLFVATLSSNEEFLQRLAAGSTGNYELSSGIQVGSNSKQENITRLAIGRASVEESQALFSKAISLGEESLLGIH